MTDLQHAQAEYELSKYLQLFHAGEGLQPADDSAFSGSLNDRIELTIVRLAAYGICLVLTDAGRLHFVTGGYRADANDPYFRVHFDTGGPSWLHLSGPDRRIWISVFQEVLAFKASDPGRLEDVGAFSIPDIVHDARTVGLSAVPGGEAHSFFAGVPLTSASGQRIGVICVFDRTNRPPLSTSEVSLLVETAQKCGKLLELARERNFHKRWTVVQRELDTFLRSRSLHSELLKSPQTSAPNGPPQTADSAESGHKTLNKVTEIPLSGIRDPPVEGVESQRLADAEIRRDHNMAARDEHELARSSRDQNHGQRSLNGETIYRKIFRRAAECLRAALEADGVVFVDGLLGFHGGIQPVAEPERELHCELMQLSVHGDKPAHPYKTHSKERKSSSRTHSKVYTSAEYLKGVYVERLAEVLGLAGSHTDLKLAQVTNSTLGLTNIDERFLQRMIDRHPNGVVWHSLKSNFKQVKEETLVEIDLEEESRRLASAFGNVRQVMFKPLTDPTSRKRLGACIVWRREAMPVFTDAVDLRSVQAFMQIVESEISRCDATHVAKQKETFVASVSHELRTPLHGILGAVQLLDQSGLDPTQKSLAKLISASGSTLHETLTSVLSYAKINQFERRQHEYRQRNPPDTVWALADKQGLASGPDRDYEGLYICTNLAMLCEETLGVLEGGKSFNSPQGSDVIVVCNIEHQENWSFLTEPGAIRRIAANLIGNALKYTKAGSVTVTLSATRIIKDERIVSNDLTSGRTVILTVLDTGRGVNKDFMDHQLFLPFTQEDSTSSHGVGLGMSIVKSLVSLLGGEIEVRSEEQKGTEINVRVPMRLCTNEGGDDDDDEKGQAAVQFERDIRTICNRRLTAVIYGFPSFVHESLTNYLCNWFDCTLLEPTKDAKPDIVLVDEGNEEVLEAVQATSRGYGKQGVLLSIVMVPSRLGQKMEMIDGYIKWERVPRPLGPNNVARALLSCLEKLDDLRKHGEDAVFDRLETEEKPRDQKQPVNAQERKDCMSSEQYMPNLEKLQISEAPQSSSLDSETATPPLGQSNPPAEDGHQSAAGMVVSRSNSPSLGPISDPAPAVRILLVDDNALNLKLLGAFFKKNGFRDTEQAKDGRQAVEAVSGSGHSFDIIFMDLSMPVMDGFEATRLIREMENGYGRASAAKEAVIIALTGLGSQEDEDAAFDAGVDMFLTKPVQFPKLSKLLHEYEEGSLQTRLRSRTK